MDEQEPTRLEHPAVTRCNWCPDGEPLARYHPDGQPEHRPLQRHDLEPDPAPQPATSDVLEQVADALELAVDLSKPHQTAARCLTLLTRLNGAVDGHVTTEELLASLRRLMADWRAS